MGLLEVIPITKEGGVLDLVNGLLVIITKLVKNNVPIIFPCNKGVCWISEGPARGHPHNYREGSARSSRGLLEIIPKIVK